MSVWAVPKVVPKAGKVSTTERAGSGRGCLVHVEVLK